MFNNVFNGLKNLFNASEEKPISNADVKDAVANARQNPEAKTEAKAFVTGDIVEGKNESQAKPDSTTASK